MEQFLQLVNRSLNCFRSRILGMPYLKQYDEFYRCVVDMAYLQPF